MERRQAKVGLTIPDSRGAQATLERVRWAEANGFEELWFADTGMSDALTLAAAVALATERARVGIAVVPVYTRSPGVLACSALTLSQLMPGRFVLGLGASSHAMIEGWHGLPYRKPRTRVAETLEIVQGLLRGEKSAYQGELLRSRGYRLPVAPQDAPLPVYVGALRPKMVQLAATKADGVVINLYPLPALRRITEAIQRAWQGAGKPLAALDVVSRIQVCVTSEVQAAQQAIRQRFAPYYATPVYNKFLGWCGYPEVAAEIAAGWADKDRQRTSAALEAQLIDQIAVIGDADTCRAKVQEHIDGGVTTAVLACPSDDPAVVQATYAAFAPAHFQPRTLPWPSVSA